MRAGSPTLHCGRSPSDGGLCLLSAHAITSRLAPTGFSTLPIWRLATSPRSALSNSCLEVDRFRDKLGSEIGENAAERITCDARCKSQATVRLPYILHH